MSYIQEKSKKLGRLVLNILVIANSAAVSTQFADISGDISEVEFDTVHYFRVIEDIEVPAGKTVRIPAGTVILFEDDKTMLIRGGCCFDGSPTRKVICSTVKDSEFNPEIPVNAEIGQEWKGITISTDADSVCFHWTDIRYADKPIETSSPRICLQGVTPVDAGNPIFIRKYIKGPIFFPAFQPSTSVLPKNRKLRVSFSLAGATTAVVSGILLACNRIENERYKSSIENYQYSVKYYKLLPASSRDSLISEMRKNYSNIEKSKNSKQSFRVASIVTGAMSVLSAAGVCFSFAFDW